MNKGTAPDLPVRTRTVQRIRTANTPQNLKKTIQLIGRAIIDGSTYLPIRDHAAAVATTARPKDYLGQLRAVFDNFISRWRYVRDPLYHETVVVSGPAIWGQVWGAEARSGQYGFGDCDDATVALGAALVSIGFPVRIATIATPGFGGLFGHVYIEAHVPRRGWIALDPVGFPRHGFGYKPRDTRAAYWNLDGQLMDARGSFPRAFEQMLGSTGQKKKRGGKMPREMFPDHGLERYGLAGTGDPLPWNEYGLKEFGAYSPQMGVISSGLGIMMEYDETDVVPGTRDLVETKMLELAPEDWRMIRTTGRPRLGCVALADDGDVYQYQQFPGTGLGFFRKIVKRVKKRVRRVVKKVRGAARKLISKLPGGKYLIRMYNKIHAVAKKLVRPLAKFVGKWAKKLAPIAAFIPGYGPAIAGALYTAGKIANVVKKVGVKLDKAGKPIFKSDKQAKDFQRELKREAEKEKRRRARKARPRGRTRRAAIPAGARVARMGTAEHAEILRGLGLN